MPATENRALSDLLNHSHRTALGARGFTLVEIVVGLAILALLLSMAYAFHLGAARNTALTGEHTVALRSVMVALESLRRDLEQMSYQCPQRDLVLLSHPELGDGRGVSLRVPDAPGADDPWRETYVPVTYQLRRVAGSKAAYHLVRTMAASGRETVLANCLLRDMLVHFLPPGSAGSPGLSPYQAYLEITMVGLGSVDGTATYTASIMVPLAMMRPAGAYTASVPLKGP